MFGLALVFGCIVGFALGLTGGGGGIFAVPLLVYGLTVSPREAVGISLAAVGGTALFGAAPRLWRSEVELRTGALFAVAGILGAPVGSLMSTWLPDSVLMVLFACLMLVVAQRMWVSAVQLKAVSGTRGEGQECGTDRSACQRDEDGKLRLNSRCARLLALVGFVTGILSGLFGVGGGFVIVPALVLFSGMAIHAAVATSLFVVVLVSISGVTSHLLSGNALSLSTTLLFTAGGFAGMWLGGLAAKRLNGPTLQKVFSAAVVSVACFMIVKSVVV